MSFQQPQAEEQRRQQEEGFAMMTYEQRVEHYYRFPPEPTERSYDTRSDMAPDGRNIGYWNRNIIAPQMQANLDRAQPKERK